MCKVPNLFKILEERGIKASKLSKDLGVSSGQISDWKSGRSKPNSDTMIALTKYLNVSAEFILGYTDEPNKKSAPSEESALDNEIMQLFAALPADKQAEAINYLQYLVSKDKP